MKAHRQAIRYLAPLLLVLLSGCVSTVTVQKATPTSKGIRYFLPEVFLKVTPKGDGTITVEELYVPNPDEEYVITTTSFLGNYTIDVNRTEHGFLEVVSFDADSSGVAKQLIASAGAVRSAEIDAQAAKAKTEAAEAKTAADKAKAALEAADKARKDAATVVDVAERRLQLLETRVTQPDPPADIKSQILTARLALVEAQAKRDAAEAAYNTLAANSAQANGIVAANAAANAGGKRPTAPGPVLYRVSMTNNEVVLKEAFTQKDHDTWKVPAADLIADPLLVLPSALVVRPAEKTGALATTVRADRQLAGVQVKSLASASGANVSNLPVVSLRPDRFTVDIDLPKSLAAGDYELDANFMTGALSSPTPNTRSFRIRVEK